MAKDILKSGLFLLIVLTSSSAALPEDSSWPSRHWQTATPSELGMDESKLIEARDYALTGGGSGYIIHQGKLVMSWGDPKQKYDLKSTTKSIGVTALGLALTDGRIHLKDRVKQYHTEFGTQPQSNIESGWLDQITILHLATQTAGFEKPGGYTPLLFEPGTRWDYSDSGPNWLAECITLIYKRDVDALMFERVFEPLGISRDDLVWRKNAYRPEFIEGIPRREFGSGISANVDAMARLGYLYLKKGRWRDQQIIPESFVKIARRPIPSVVGLEVLDPEKYCKASEHYGLLWWNNSDNTLDQVPRDAYWSWGLYDSFIVVIPSLDLVISRAGKSWERQWSGHYSVLKPFLEPIAASIRKPFPPYPPSAVITNIEWADSETIIRKAEGGDNWPLTWASDDNLYTAYGDGWGFDPKVPDKLSLGLARVSGNPPEFKGINIRSDTGERIGQGAEGEKASGILMVDDTLYMLIRNVGNSQLGWSEDYGETWSWSNWKFTTSFGHPTFLNFGKNYEGARDNFVYIYSHDHASAYEPADQMVMARVSRDQIKQQTAYTFFQSRDKAGSTSWTEDISRRGPVFYHANRCYRSMITYNPALKRYLWCQIVPGGDTRFEGGLGIYDAAEPWGPWTTVFFTSMWDVGPGENCGFPSKWMSKDGKTLHLVFSGDDYFSVRKATLTTSSARKTR